MSAWGYFIPNCFFKKHKEANVCVLYCDRGLQTTLLPQCVMHLALFSNHLKKTGKYMELCVLLIIKSVLSFAFGSQFYHCGLKSPKALSIYLKKKILPFHDKNWRCALRKYSVLNNNNNGIRESLLASDQCILEIPRGSSELRTQLCLRAWCCSVNGSVLSTATVTQAGTGTQDGHPQPCFGPAPRVWGCPARHRSIPGKCQARAGTHCTQECLENQHLEFVEKGCSSWSNRIRDAN